MKRISLFFFTMLLCSNSGFTQKRQELDLRKHRFVPVDISASELTIETHYAGKMAGTCGISLVLSSGASVSNPKLLLQKITIESLSGPGTFFLNPVLSKQGVLSFEWPWAKEDTKFMDLIKISTKNKNETLKEVFRKYLIGKPRTGNKSEKEERVSVTLLLCQDGKPILPIAN